MRKLNWVLLIFNLRWKCNSICRNRYTLLLSQRMDQHTLHYILFAAIGDAQPYAQFSTWINNQQSLKRSHALLLLSFTLPFSIYHTQIQYYVLKHTSIRFCRFVNRWKSPTLILRPHFCLLTRSTTLLDEVLVFFTHLHAYVFACYHF